MYLPEIILSPDKVLKRTFEATTFYESVNYINILFWIGVGVFSILFLIKLMKIINLIRTNKAEKVSIFRLIFIPNKTNAFSFFNYIFLGNEIPVSQQEKIIQHEMVHSQQKHSLDLLLFEFLKIAMWFNPMIYLYQKRITLLHEYISDAIVAKSEAKEIYINNLLSNYFQVENISFVNQFYKKSLIKKRIIMMTKKQSKKMNQLKYLVLIPVLASMLFYTSCSETELNENLVSKKEAFKMYMISDGKLDVSELTRETYLDAFLGDEIPREFIMVPYSDLNENEQEEFDKMKERFGRPNYNRFEPIKIFKLNSNRKIIGYIKEKTEIVTETEEVSFMSIDKAPTFPGCESGDKNCFSKSVQTHFSQNFDVDLPNNLGLSAGRKRVFIGFKIDTKGNIVDVQVRAPHPDIKKEVISVMNSLPKMIPGENNGKVVAVKYSIPFTIVVE